LLLRHQELQRTHELLAQQLSTVSLERNSLRSRLNAARGRIDALLERLPSADLATASTSSTKESS
jgi:cell division protein ZapB